MTPCRKTSSVGLGGLCLKNRPTYHHCVIIASSKSTLPGIASYGHKNTKLKIRILYKIIRIITPVEFYKQPFNGRTGTCTNNFIFIHNTTTNYPTLTGQLSKYSTIHKPPLCSLLIRRRSLLLEAIPQLCEGVRTSIPSAGSDVPNLCNRQGPLPEELGHDISLRTAELAVDNNIWMKQPNDPDGAAKATYVAQLLNDHETVIFVNEHLVGLGELRQGTFWMLIN